MDLTLFVLGHERNSLEAIADLPHIRKVYLPALNASNRLAESRVFQSELLLNCNSEYIGLASSSWNIKYGGDMWNGRIWPPCLPIERLHELPLEPGIVWAAAPTDNVFWSEDLDAYFPGIQEIIEELIETFGLKQHYRIGVLANNFIAHRSIVQDHCRFMRACIEYLDGKYGKSWPLSPDRMKLFANRLEAFACEAISILYFVNRTDLAIRKIPAPG